MRSFKANPHFRKELEAQPSHRQMLRRAAREVVRAAKALSPDGGPHKGYRETLRVRTVDDEVRAESTDIAAHIVEFGSRNNPPYAPLRRGVRAAGLDLKETPKH